jgi:ABC-type phosphate transport system permease subunit
MQFSQVCLTTHPEFSYAALSITAYVHLGEEMIVSLVFGRSNVNERQVTNTLDKITTTSIQSAKIVTSGDSI